MNVTTLVDELALLLNKSRPAEQGAYVVFVEGGALKLTRHYKVPKGVEVICRLVSLDINGGLTSEGWDRATAKLADYAARNTLRLSAAESSASEVPHA